MKARPWWFVLYDARFWATQLLVVAIAGLHTLLEARSPSLPTQILYFVPEALFLIPVGYAALNFGLSGSLPTALWCTLLALPNLLIWHQGEESSGILFQLGIIIAVGFFVGQRVDQETQARRQAEHAQAALQVSEARYRALFESSADGVIVFDQAGIVREANPAAGELCDRPAANLQGLPLLTLLGQDGADRLLEYSAGPGLPSTRRDLAYHRASGAKVSVEAVCTFFTDVSGETLLQASLRDVTRQRQRQQELRSFAAHVLEVQEEERRRIAQELHDDVVQGLILLCRRLDTAEEQTSARAEPARAEIAAARQATEEMVSALRNFTRGLRPPALDDLGAITSIRRLLDDLGARTGINWEISVEGEQRRLTPAAELGLFRIAQEAIRNVERHAGATQIQVELRFHPARVELAISDNGRGFRAPAPSESEPAGGLGLVGMQERATSLGGSLGIMSAPEQGTTIAAAIPVQPAG